MAKNSIRHKKQTCGGDDCYCDGNKGICLIIEPRNAVNNSAGTNEGVIECAVDGLTMTMTILEENNPDFSPVFNVYEEYSLEPVKELFNNKVITILPGNYTVDYTNFEFGEIVVDININ